jgi:hypothetical protein
MYVVNDFFVIASIVGLLVSQAGKGLVSGQEAAGFIVALAAGFGLYRRVSRSKPSGCLFLSVAVTLLSVWTLLLGSTMLVAVEFWTLVIMAFGVYVMCGGLAPLRRRSK